MKLEFSAKIEGSSIICHITSDTNVTKPVFCFSLMAPSKVVTGGQMTRAVAGYSEVLLPDLNSGQPHEIILEHVNPVYKPANRSWLPLGAYLRLSDGLQLLPELETGVSPAQSPTLMPFEGLRLVPQPTLWTQSIGICDLTRGVATNAETFERAHQLSKRSQLGHLINPDGVPLTLEDDPSLPVDAYRINILPHEIHISANGDGGQLYAAISLIWLAKSYGAQVPCGTIVDEPRFEWRGQHLDCARHFYQPETLHKFVDLMALLKLNRFHFHFADDEAFRLEVDCFPDLWKKTAFRGEDELIPSFFGGGIRSGGSYSKVMIGDLLAHAKQLNMEIMPELEVPAHSYAMIKAVPGLRDHGDNGAEESIQGYQDNAINPAVSGMWDVTVPLAVEISEIFSFNIVHLGCDELAEDTWAGSAAVRQLKLREGLETTEDVQGWAMHKLAATLVEKDVRSAAWEEAARGKNGGIGNNALLFSWTGQGAGVAAARHGYDVVMCPAQNIYFDMAHTNDPSDWGASWAAFINLEDTIDWSPIPLGAEDIEDKVVGIEGTFWSEFTTQDDQIWPMLMPRMLGLANKAWDKNDSLDGKNLRAIANESRSMFAKNWGWHNGA